MKAQTQWISRPSEREKKKGKNRSRASGYQWKFVGLRMPATGAPMCIILRKVNHHWLLWFLSALVVNGAVAGNPDAKRLYDDLLSNYNKLVRPVVNTSDVLRVCIKLKLSQLIDVVSWTIRFSSPSVVWLLCVPTARLSFHVALLIEPSGERMKAIKVAL